MCMWMKKNTKTSKWPEAQQEHQDFYLKFHDRNSNHPCKDFSQYSVSLCQYGSFEGSCKNCSYNDRFEES